MVSGWWRWCARGEVEGFSLLRSNRASEAGHPWFISVATGTGDPTFKCTSIVPCKKQFQKHSHAQSIFAMWSILILRDHNPSVGNNFTPITVEL